jgi:hypothetical protein
VHERTALKYRQSKPQLEKPRLFLIPRASDLIKEERCLESPSRSSGDAGRRSESTLALDSSHQPFSAFADVPYSRRANDGCLELKKSRVILNVE